MIEIKSVRFIFDKIAKAKSLKKNFFSSGKNFDPKKKNLKESLDDIRFEFHGENRNFQSDESSQICSRVSIPTHSSIAKRKNVEECRRLKSSSRIFDFHRAKSMKVTHLIVIIEKRFDLLC